MKSFPNKIISELSYLHADLVYCIGYL